MKLHNDISRCSGDHCKHSMKSTCKRWIKQQPVNNQTPISNFRPEKHGKGIWKCDFKIDKRD